MSRYIDLFLVWLGHQGPLAYGILFAILFVETGVVIFPFLPGDSLLFAVGTLLSRPDPPLQLAWTYPLLIAAALLGDNCNYFLGQRFGRSLFRNEQSKVFRRENLEKTERFFAKHGGKAVIMARFVPIVRTFAPFVAGMGAMPYPRFLAFSVAGAFLWVVSCVTLGYFFGQIPWVSKNFEIVVVGIILLSLVPALVEYVNHRRAERAGAS